MEKPVQEEKGSLNLVEGEKKKGFHGQKTWGIRRETESDGRHDTGVETCVEPQPSTSRLKMSTTIF